MDAKLTHNPKVLAGLAGLAALLVYIPVLKGGFVLNDAHSIAQSGGSPFAGLSLLVDRSIWGMDPLGFHLTNALLHAANSMLVFAAGFMLLKKDSPWPALLAALVFALHPANTEAVSWISVRGELIYSAFFLLSFVSYLHYEKDGRSALLILVGIFLFLSLLASEKAIVLVAVTPLYAIAVSKSAAGRIKNVIPIAAMCALALGGFYVFRFLVPGVGIELAVKNHLFELGITPGLGYYAGRLLLPVNHVLFPSVPGGVAFIFAGLSLIAAAALLYAWHLRLEAFLTAWIVIALLPSFFFIDPSGAVLAEHHLYLSATAFSVLLASVLWRIRNRPALVAVSLAIIAGYALFISARSADWKDEDRLLSPALAKDEYSLYEHPRQASYVLTTLGLREMEAGEYENAREHLREAIAADEKNYMAYYHSGHLFEMLYEEHRLQGDVEAGIATAREAVEVLENGKSHFPGYVYINYNLGIWQMRLLDWNKAEENFRTVLVLNPPLNTKAATVDFLKLITEIKKSGLSGYNPAEELLSDSSENMMSIIK